MRRWMFIAALSATLIAVPLWAQRGGHGGMGGGHAGMGMSGGHGVSGAPHGGGSWGGGYHGGGNWGGGYHGGYGHGPYGHPGHYPYYPGHYPYYRYPWGYGGYYGYGYPWLSFGWYGGAGWSGAYYSYPEQAYPNYVYASPDNGNDNAAYNQQQAQIDQLNNEVDRLRTEREADTARNYVPQPPKPEIRASTVLVFRDQHSEEIENYAIVGKTVWVFTEQRARKIPISELNISATTQANEARGIDFRLPAQ